MKTSVCKLQIPVSSFILSWRAMGKDRTSKAPRMKSSKYTSQNSKNYNFIVTDMVDYLNIRLLAKQIMFSINRSI